MSQIVKNFVEYQNRLVLQSSDLSLESIANMVDNNAIDVSPGYQRRERWTNKKESALIESFLLNIPVPPIYLAEDEYGKYSVIDGKQRITAIHRFITNNLKLQNLEKFEELNHYTFNDLPAQLRNALSIRPYIRVVTLLNQSDPNLKYEVFLRLNTGGDNLLPQEIRNAAFRGPINELIFELSENKFLRQQLKIKNKTEKAYKHMLDVEYVLRFFTLRETWEHFPGNMQYAMNEFMSRYQHASPRQIGAFRHLFNISIEACEKIWGDKAFLRPDGEDYRNLILQGFYDAQMVPLSFVLKPKDQLTTATAKRINSAFMREYEHNAEFQDSMRQFTSNPEHVAYRIHRMITILETII